VAQQTLFLLYCATNNIIIRGTTDIRVPSMDLEIIGRKEEQTTLQDFYDSGRPEFLAIYGRRRIGKTYLIKQFFQKKKCIFFNITGIQDGTMDLQISRFTKEIGNKFYKGTKIQAGKTWLETLDALTKAIQEFTEPEQKIVLFFDEFPWMATHRSGLLQALDHIWNQTWSNDPRIKLIICGSSASWIINKIINNKAGLHNRITRKIRLMPFNLQETNAFLAAQGVKLNHKQISQLYMVCGGIPYYLTNLKKGLSATQIIETLAFKQESLLFKEFDNLFASLFADSESYIELLRIIAKNRYGVNQADLIKKSKSFSRGGGATRKLTELEEAGFIISFTPHLHKKRGVYYRLIDEYTLFYIDWIEPIRKTLQKESLESGYWESQQKSAAWYSWAGYAFESICYKHLSFIRKKLNIPPTAIANGWRFVPKAKSTEQGAQIDLLFDRKDDSVTLCEIKYTDEPFKIDKSYAAALQRKIDVFRERTRTKKQLFFALISANGLQETMYSEEMIQGFVTLDDLF
jgi:AAA+ ATPase superfamily predicted ATPase